MAIPKYGGRDNELSTTGIDADGRALNPWHVTRAILDAIPAALAVYNAEVWNGNRQQQNPYSGNSYSVDCLRNWTSGGQCYYADMSHVEACTAACLRPTDFAHQCLSLVIGAEAARRLAEQQAAHGERYMLTTSNADGLDPAISFGTHLNIQVETSLWENLMVDQRRPGVFGFVTSAIAAAVPFFGAGYLLPLKDGTTIYSLSARAHHLTRMRTQSTTEPFGRGLLNSRREPHERAAERLHLIGFDLDLASSGLLFSFLQCVLAAAEEGYSGMVLFDPVRALRTWSWHLDMTTGTLAGAAVSLDGRRMSLPDYMGELSQALLDMCRGGLITDAVAPEATEMLPRIVELAAYAREGSLVRCARHLGWAAKLLWLVQLSEQNGAALGDPTTRLADHDFCSTDPERGAFWRLWDQGLIDPLVDLDQAKRCLAEGPADSRDWGRGQIIGRFLDHIAAVDWSYVDVRTTPGFWGARRRIEFPCLDSLNQAELQPILRRAAGVEHLLHLLDETGQPVGKPHDPVEDITGELAVLPPSN